MSDHEPAPHDPKKARRNPSAEPSSRRDPIRDPKRRRKKRRKTPIVAPGAPKDEVTQPRPGGPSRSPLSPRNEIIRFTSVPPEVDQPASSLSVNRLSSKQLGKSPVSSSSRFDPGDHLSQTTLDGEKAHAAAASSSSLSDEVTKLEAELKSKNNLIDSQRALLNQVQQAVTCEVCLDLMYKPFALAPCGHLACHSCLVSWFTAPPSDNRPTPPAVMRKKTCPHCRAVVRERPVEVWSVKNIAQAMSKSGLLQNQLPVPDEPSESLDANPDPWKGIFPKPGPASHRGFPWFFHGADIGDDDVHINNFAPRGDDVGMLDMEDGGVYRCLDCMHEIWDGVCSSCGRVYPGHVPGEDDDDDGYGENPMEWLEERVGAEEVDIADDPGWIGLEGGEADDDGGDLGDWYPYGRRHNRALRGPWGFIGTIHVEEEDEEEEEDGMFGRVDDPRVPDEDEVSEDEGYESSFIDDDDERDGTAGTFDRPRFYEIGDDEDKDHHPNLVSEDHQEDEEEGSDTPERRWTRRRHAPVVVSSDEEADELEGDPHFSLWRLQNREHENVDSDNSDPSRSDA